MILSSYFWKVQIKSLKKFPRIFKCFHSSMILKDQKLRGAKIKYPGKYCTVEGTRFVSLSKLQTARQASSQHAHEHSNTQITVFAELSWEFESTVWNRSSVPSTISTCRYYYSTTAIQFTVPVIQVHIPLTHTLVQLCSIKKQFHSLD